MSRPIVSIEKDLANPDFDYVPTQEEDCIYVSSLDLRVLLEERSRLRDHVKLLQEYSTAQLEERRRLEAEVERLNILLLNR
jgi:hypothetical protein